MKTLTRPEQRPTAGRPIVTGAAIGIALGWTIDTIVYAIGTPIRVRTGWQTSGAKLGVVEYLATISIAILLGAGLLALLRRSANSAQRWELVAAAVAVISAVPLWRLDIPVSSKTWLTAMHGLTGAAAIGGHRIARRIAHTSATGATR